MPPTIEPKFIFLGFCERANLVQQGNTHLQKTNFLGWWSAPQNLDTSEKSDDVFHYIEVLYRRQRRYSPFSLMNPAHFKNQTIQRNHIICHQPNNPNEEEGLSLQT